MRFRFSLSLLMLAMLLAAVVLGYFLPGTHVTHSMATEVMFYSSSLPQETTVRVVRSAELEFGLFYDFDFAQETLVCIEAYRERARARIVLRAGGYLALVEVEPGASENPTGIIPWGDRSYYAIPAKAHVIQVDRPWLMDAAVVGLALAALSLGFVRGLRRAA